MVDTQDTRSSRGLSRRDMIKGAAVAGAAAWTAPVIIDSLMSPAAAGSVCNHHWVKITETGACYNACPGDSSLFPLATGTGNPADKWAGTCSAPNGPSGSCGAKGDGTTVSPAVSSYDSTYYQVVIGGSACKFTSTSDWQIGGRYGDGSGSDTYLKVSVNATSPSGNGAYNNNTGTGWIKKKNGSKDLQWIYLKFCCS